MNKISIEDLIEQESRDKDYVVLDVRSTQNYEAGHISGAISFPLHKMCDATSRLPDNKALIVYSQNARDAMATQAVLALQELGFDEVQVLECGLDEWQALDNPVEVNELQTMSGKNISYKTVAVPYLDKNKVLASLKESRPIPSDDVVKYLEDRTHIFEFDHLGYEIKTVEKIKAIYLMINPDPLNFALVPQDSLVISHHKISTHKNRIYSGMLDQARKNRFNIFNFHLGWDVMPGGIGDSFLLHYGLSQNEFKKVDLTYRRHTINNLGLIIDRQIAIEELLDRLNAMNVFPSIIINPKCTASKIGYIPGGGFVDNMIIEMADYGVDVLISSDHNWIVETVARELGMTLVEINHYVSERYGLQTMRKILASKFPGTVTSILENIDNIECSENDCSCNV